MARRRSPPEQNLNITMLITIGCYVYPFYFLNCDDSCSYHSLYGILILKRAGVGLKLSEALHDETQHRAALAGEHLQPKAWNDLTGPRGTA